jgi:photosystem II stability/assembly factor-like uncharacterized protein
MKKYVTLVLIAVFAVSSAVVASATPTPVQQDVVSMVKKGTHKTKRGTKAVYHVTKNGTKVVYHRTKVGGKWVYHKGHRGGAYAFHKVKRGGKWTYHKVKRGVVGKPKPRNL